MYKLLINYLFCYSSIVLFIGPLLSQSLIHFHINHTELVNRINYFLESPHERRHGHWTFSWFSVYVVDSMWVENSIEKIGHIHGTWSHSVRFSYY